MMNFFTIVGRIKNQITEENEKGGKRVNVEVIVLRPFKNTNGEYESDIISVALYGTMATLQMEYLKTGDVIGIKGRIERLEDEPMRLVADKVSFLSSNKDILNNNQESEGK